MNNVVVNNWVVLLRKMPSLLFGLFLFAMGVVANLYSDLGMSPWGVLSVGIAGRTPLTIGQASQVVGFVVLAIGWLLGYVPGLGTVANMYFIGLFVDVIMAWGLLPLPSDDVGRFMMLFFSVVLIGVASYFYLRVRLGAGPRDGLMMGLMRRLNRPASTIRGTIEVTVLVAGYLLGGPVGIGTVVSAFTLGYSVQLAFKIGKFDPKSADQVNLLRLIRCLSGEGSLS